MSHLYIKFIVLLNCHGDEDKDGDEDELGPLTARAVVRLFRDARQDCRAALSSAHHLLLLNHKMLSRKKTLTFAKEFGSISILPVSSVGLPH